MMRSRRAAVNKKLIVVLALTVLAAAGFWIVKSMSGPDTEVGVGVMTIYCPTCGKQQLDPSKAKWKGSKFLCPNCNEYIATPKEPTNLPEGLGESP